ncbi:MAG: hypothetical protein Q7T96_19885 [Methylobacter sp.]|nr:hypothetical protein [Methylobacter sp.]
MNGIAPTSDRIESDPLAKTIVSMINAMEADYGQTFIKQFRDAEVLKNYKRRLYQKLKDLPIDAIVNGYELCAERNTKFCPTVPGIVECVLETVKRNKKLNANKVEAEGITALPAPTIICDPLALLAKAKAASRTDSKEDKTAWMARKAEALRNNEAVLILHGYNIKRRYAQPEHLCVVNGCRDTGTLSNGTKGSDNWFCINHFKTAS